MINNVLMSQFKDNETLNKPSITVRVEVYESDMVHLLAQKLKSEFDRMAPYASYTVISDLTGTDIEKYLKTITWLRVCHVMDETSQCRDYRPLTKRLAIPVLYYQLMLCIGRVHDSEFNLEFVPAYSITEDDLLSVDQMEAISSVFRQFENSGMKVVYGMPKDRSGELDFMAMSHVSNEVTSYRHSHPVYGFLAAFFRQKQLNEVTGCMSRVVYGYESDYRYELDALFAAINRGCDHDR